MQRVTDVECSQVNCNEFRQIARQAGDIQFSRHVADDAGVQFDCWRYICVDEMQWHFNVNFLCCIDALEISVQDQLFVCVDLEVAQQDFFCFAIDFQIQDR